MLTLSLPGVSVTYYGEEIGMLDNLDISYSQNADPAGCLCGPLFYLNPGCSRDPQRTPYQWDKFTNAGFTAPLVEPWLPINANYQEINLDSQKSDASSPYTIFKNMINYRKTQPTFINGTTEITVIGNFLVVSREFEGEIIITVINFGERDYVNVLGIFPNMLEGTLLLASDAYYPPG